MAAVAFDDHENVLLIRRRDTGRWEIPGGVLELDESIEEGLCREVLEETGSVVQVEALTSVYKNMQMGVVALIFRARTTGNHAASTAEATDVAMVPLSKAVQLMPPAWSSRVLDARRSGHPTIRSHDGTTFTAGEAHLDQRFRRT